MIAAVVLAAGAGQRLGGVCKAALPTESGSFLARIHATGTQAGVTHWLVVAGPPFSAEVRKLAAPLDATVCENPTPEKGMSSSIAVGFATLCRDPRGASRAFLWPVDHPYVRPETLRAVTAVDAPCVVPSVNNKGGHPPLIERSLWRDLARCHETENGARGVLRPVRTWVTVNDPGCLRDVDRPEDL